MIALSIRQPWAQLILDRGKDVENRSWPCPSKHVGTPILLHAGLAKPTEHPSVYHYMEMQRGGIIGMLQFSASITDSMSDWAEPGMHHWVIQWAKSVPFFPSKGALGFFTVEYPQHLLGGQHV